MATTSAMAETRRTRPTGKAGEQPLARFRDRLRQRGRAAQAHGRRWLKGWDPQRAANALGWFSIALGLAEVAMPRRLIRFFGVRDRRMLLRGLGVREIISGLGLLTGQSRRSRAGWLWARVGGDAMDLAVLANAMASPRGRQGRVVAATAAVAGITALDVLCARQFSRGEKTQSIHVKRSITINRSSEEVYRFWRELENLPRFMKHLHSVRAIGDGRSHWVAKGPAGTTVEWDAQTTEDQPNQQIAWRSLEGADVEHSGSVRFESAPGGRGTIVRVEIRYAPPAGMIGSLVAKLFGEEPGQQVQEDLHRFKQVMEVGEVLTTQGQPAGRPRSTSWKYDRV